MMRACGVQSFFFSSVLSSVALIGSLSNTFAGNSPYPLTVEIAKSEGGPWVTISNASEIAVTLNRVQLNGRKDCIFVPVNYEGNSDGLEAKDKMTEQEIDGLKLGANQTVSFNYDDSACKSIQSIKLISDAGSFEWKPHRELTGSDSVTEIASIDDERLAQICAEVSDNSGDRTLWEDRVVGAKIRVTMIASSYSSEEKTLVGEKQDRMGARLLPSKIIIDVSEISIPAELKKNGRFILSGTINDGVFWGNVFEGCFFNVKASEIEADGF